LFRAGEIACVEHKKVRRSQSILRTYRIRSPDTRESLSLYHEESLSVQIRQVFWLTLHPSGAFPVKTSGMEPVVHVYSGGSAGELHPSSLSSLRGHLSSRWAPWSNICLHIEMWIFLVMFIRDCGECQGDSQHVVVSDTDLMVLADFIWTRCL